MDIIKQVILNSLLGVLITATYIGAGFFEQRDYFCPNKTLMWGSIQFPKNIEHVPDIRIYYSGQRIKCEINHDLKRITYAIPDTAHKTQFKMLITDNLEFASEYNVIKYLKVRQNTPYKFFQVDLVRLNPTLCSLEQQFDNDHVTNSQKMNWYIKEYRNTLDKGRIPDDTIIICCKSSYIDKLESIQETTLPTIKIRPDLIQVAGSEKQLHENADELIISLLDYDTIHATMHQEEIRPSSSPKTILSITT